MMVCAGRCTCRLARISSSPQSSRVSPPPPPPPPPPPRVPCNPPPMCRPMELRAVKQVRPAGPTRPCQYRLFFLWEGARANGPPFLGGVERGEGENRNGGQQQQFMSVMPTAASHITCLPACLSGLPARPTVCSSPPRI
jgi:hypothetical protein